MSCSGRSLPTNPSHKVYYLPLHLLNGCGDLQKAGDRGALARASGDYAIVVSHNPDVGITRIKLPSGSKKVGPNQIEKPFSLCCPTQVPYSGDQRKEILNITTGKY